MNILLLLVAARLWSPISSCARLTRVFAAISLFSLEMQLATWLSIGSIRTLPILNAVIAIAALAFWRPAVAPRRPDGLLRAVGPGAALAVMALFVAALNLLLPIEAADPYHLEKVDHIRAAGTLAYLPGAAVKVNLLGSVYELLLADLSLVPMIGPWLWRLHGVFGLLGYGLAVGAARELLRPRDDAATGADAPARSAWRWAVLLLVPAFFHQLVLIKNDLFIALPSLAVLAWIVARAETASSREIAWAGWLAGVAVAIKLTTLPLLVVVGLALRWLRRDRLSEWRGLAIGTAIGLACGGLFFGLVENVRTYGSLMPASEQGNVNGPISMFVGLVRFVISLFDLGLVTRDVWPGRGGWGGTFGLPIVWALAVLAYAARSVPLATNTLRYAGVYLLLFAAVFSDADLAHRLALAPGVLLLVVALTVVDRLDRARLFTLALVPVALLSAAQIARSAYLYFMR